MAGRVGSWRSEETCFVRQFCEALARAQQEQAHLAAAAQVRVCVTVYVRVCAAPGGVTCASHPPPLYS